MSLPEFVDNGRERCYYCKKFLFGKVMDIAEKNGFGVIADGTNVDDANLIRPGIKALHELGIRSPLFDLAFTKKDIRDLSRKLGLSSFRKQSMSCLATRFPYDLRIDKEKLSRISACEEYLYSSGLRTYRVRLGGMNGEIARIEVMPEDINNVVDNREDIISFFREKGFKYVTVDLEGFRSGSMDI